MYLAKKLKIFFIFFLIIFFEAQKSWSLENKILFKVDNEIITTIDIYEEIKFLKTFNPEISSLSKEELFEISKNSIVRDKIKKIEILNFIEEIMTIIVKSEITITKGFETWKRMVQTNLQKLKTMGISFLFAGTAQDDPTKLVAVMRFDSMEALKSFGADEELTEQRREAGAVIDSGIMTIMSDDFFTNYPKPFIKI